MDWTAPINAYCERTDQSYWAEPVNAVTNLAFILAALAALALYHRRGGNDRAVLLLIAIVLIVGVGSFLFHTHANRWSLLADVIPIMVFIYSYFFIAMRRMLGFGSLAAAGLLMGYVLFSFGFSALLPPGFLHGSGSYLPALLAVVAVALVLRARGHPCAMHLFSAAGVFAISLTFRTLDQTVCAAFPIGTHFLWHLLNALLLFLLVRAMMLASDATPALKRTSGVAA
jgi:hypothetical protein